MKKIILIASLASQSILSLSGNPISVKSKIESVTVYRQGAEVINIATVDVPSGQSEIVFEGLSNNVNPSSLQVSGTSGITLLSAIYQMNYLKEENLPAAIAIEDSIQKLNLELNRLTTKKNVFEDEESMLKANQSIGGSNTGVSVTELQKAADFMRSRLMEVKNKIIDLEQDEKKLNDKINKLKNQLNEFNQKNRPMGEVVLNVSAKSVKNITFRISYLVTGAGWSPVYDIRAEKLNEPVTLVYKANVHQNTGVKWENVKLALSTGNPTVGQSSPTLDPWFVDFYNPYSVINGRTGAEGVMLDAVKIKSIEVISDDGEYLPEEKYTLKDQVMITENQINVEFQLGIPYTIPSDGKEQLVAMDEYLLDAGYTYYAVPKIETDAFLVADVTGWEDINLLAGKANIFFEGNYIGQSNIDPKATGDTLRVSLGRDNKVNIKRDLLKDFTSRKFIATNKKETFGYEISVKNTKSQNIKIEIEDQVPVSNNSQIIIDAEEISNAECNKETGKLKWKLELASAESKQVRLVYSVKYPKNKTVAGL